MKLPSKAFWVYAGERAVKTAAQSALSLLTVGYAGILDVNYVQVGSTAGLAALLSVLTSLTKFEESVPDGPAHEAVEEIAPDAADALREADSPFVDPDATREIQRHRA